MRASQRVAFASSFSKPRTSPFAKNRLVPQEPAVGTPVVALEVGQRVICPGHGVGVVLGLGELPGQKIPAYIVKVQKVDLYVRCDRVGLEGGVRPIASSEVIQQIYTVLRENKIAVELTSWNRRKRQYMEKVRTGSLIQIAEVVRDFCLIRANKTLSDGEKEVFRLARGLLVRELAIAEGTDEPTIEAQIEDLYSTDS